MNEQILLSLAAIGILGSFAQWFSWWVKLPAILFLLLIGLVLGPLTGWLEPDVLFGDLLFPMVSLSVAVILFEGSLTLHFDQIKGLQRVVRNMVSFGMMTTWIVISVATWLVIDFDWPLAFLFGALVVVTGPTVIVPMLRTVRPNARIANILRWEGIAIDPLGALLAVLVFDFIIATQQGHGSFIHLLLSFGKILTAGILLGAIAGQGLGVVLRRHWLPEYLFSVVTLTLVFVVFVLANMLQDEAGLLAVTVMGVWLANMKGVPIEDILDFKESLSVLLISGLFIILASRVDISQLVNLGWGAVVLFLVVQFVARPLKVLVTTWGSSLSWQERALLAWIAPRGIVAAAVSALFALQLEQAGYPQAPLLVSLTFMVILGTVILQSATARPIASWLGVAEPEPRGLLIIGGNPVARMIAMALNEQGFHTLLLDTHWPNIRKARMGGLQTFYGNPISEHADRHLDLVGIGRLLSLSLNNEMNALAVMRYQREFGKQNVYSLVPADEKKKAKDKHAVAMERIGKLLFGAEITYARLASWIANGAEIKATQLSDEFSYDDYMEKNNHKIVPLFAVSPNKRHLVVFTEPPEKRRIIEGWTILSLYKAEKKNDAANE